MSNCHCKLRISSMSFDRIKRRSCCNSCLQDSSKHLQSSQQRPSKPQGAMHIAENLRISAA